MIRPDSWLGMLPDELRERVLRRMHRRSVAAGEHVYLVGDSGTDAYIVVSGRFRLSNHSRSGKEIQALDLLEGDGFGEISLIDGLSRSTNAHAVEAGELLVLQRPDFEALVGDEPSLARSLNVHLCRLVRSARASAEDAALLTLRDRLPALLADIARSQGEASDSGDVILPNLSQRELASMLGVTRQSVSRELKELEQAGRIELRYRQILVHDVDALADRAGRSSGRLRRSRTDGLEPRD